MRIMLIGANGLLGHELLKLFPDAAAPRSSTLDITDEAAVRAALEYEKPDILINCAAMTNVDDCEIKRKKALAVNTVGPLYLHRACDLSGARFVNIGTDFVFDGEQTSPIPSHAATAPVNYYGMTKLQAERFADCTIRVQWLYGEKRPTFPEYVLSGSAIKAPVDCVGSPTAASDAAMMIKELMEQDGIFHAANTGETSKYGFAVETARTAGKETRPIPIEQSDLKRPAKRPRYTVLRSSPMKRAPRPWQEALYEYLKTKE